MILLACEGCCCFIGVCILQIGGFVYLNCEEWDVAHGAMGCRIDPSWGRPIELFLVPASAPWLV